MTGAIYAARRQPTPAEIKQINDSLAAMEKGTDASATTSTQLGRSASERDSN
jgi:hypothetical protein